MEPDQGAAMLVGLPEAARRMALGLSMLKLLVQRGALQSIRVGKRRLIPVSAIEAFIAKRMTDGAK